MNTKRWNLKAVIAHADQTNDQTNDQTIEQSTFIQEAAEMIKQGEVVAFPTETVYGLGADATSTLAVQKIFEAKGRPNDNPLIIHISNINQLDGVADTSSLMAQQLMAHFWPGPLALVLPVIEGALSKAVTAGLNTVAVRMPDQPIALALIEASGCLIAAPSANRSGRPSPTKAEHVLEDLDGRIAGVLDGGSTGVGVESTVVELLENQVRILRPGGITTSQLKEVVDVIDDQQQEGPLNQEEAPRSPGMKYTHYAPKGLMTIVKGSSPDVLKKWIQQDIDIASLRGERTGILTYEPNAASYRADLVATCGRMNHPEEIAQQLYEVLRRFDQQKISYILAEACPREGLGDAIMNRLMKAAAYRLVELKM